MSKLALTAIIVDDDPFSCFHLQDVIKHKTSDLEILAVCNNGDDALKQIFELSPDIVFLDIEMPGSLNGFELLKKLPVINFEIIFTTAHEHYAIRAIRFAALDYLVKPVDIAALQEALSRVREKRMKATDFSFRKLELVKQDTGKIKFENLAVPTMEGLLFIDMADIIYCEGQDKYTKIFTAGSKTILASQNLGNFEELLTAYNFFRIHKSYLVNLNHIKRYLRGEGGQVIMTNEKALDVSRRRKEELLRIVLQH
ncbi:MAG TPA: LytTR family DNA-binding domain-containing protein [Flavipsychrobacter sp.]|jgi:two-component system LytT family response regulator|nr:LytTR family DNA-binding domain-containing protein [Flavipsychrobacter sp.]